jgi:hypothetical protein
MCTVAWKAYIRNSFPWVLIQLHILFGCLRRVRFSCSSKMVFVPGNMKMHTHQEQECVDRFDWIVRLLPLLSFIMCGVMKRYHHANFWEWKMAKFPVLDHEATRVLDLLKSKRSVWSVYDFLEMVVFAALGVYPAEGVCHPILVVARSRWPLVAMISWRLRRNHYIRLGFGGELVLAYYPLALGTFLWIYGTDCGCPMESPNWYWFRAGILTFSISGTCSDVLYFLQRRPFWIGTVQLR